MSTHITTRQILLASRPVGLPTLDNFKLETIELPKLQIGEVTLQCLYYSVDPYMRGRMNDAKSYVPPFQINQPLEGSAIAKVTGSNSQNFKKGDIVFCSLPWQEDCVVADTKVKSLNPTISPISYYLGILGMTGLTAYTGLMLIGKPKAGETVVVSGAAGAVGLVVGQIAKIQGCRVIGIAGSDEKVKLLKEEFDFDDTINYKTTTDIKKSIQALCPTGVDIYFDNVGGALSDAVISQINFHARIPLCGQIALYNSEISMGPRIQPMLLTRSALMQGFIVRDFESHFPEARQQLAQWVTESKLKFSETILHGFDQLPHALLGLFRGENTGKMIVRA